MVWIFKWFEKLERSSLESAMSSCLISAWYLCRGGIWRNGGTLAPLNNVMCY